MPRISIILPTYNRADELPKAIDSVLNQTYEDFELIVIDDGSTDNTQEILKQFATDKRVKICRQENQGASAARNLGLSKARSDLIAFQDSDDIWRADKLEKQLAVIDADPECGIVYSDMQRILENGKTYYMSVPEVTGNNVINPGTGDYQVLGIGMQTVLVRKAVTESVGGFDTSLPRFIDLDWFVRIARETKFTKINEALVYYYEMPGISSNPQKAATARKILLEKYAGEIKANKFYLSTQLTKIATAYWKAGDNAAARTFARRSFLLNPLNMKHNLKLLIISLLPSSIRNFLPKMILDKYW